MSFLFWVLSFLFAGDILKYRGLPGSTVGCCCLKPALEAPHPQLPTPKITSLTSSTESKTILEPGFSPKDHVRELNNSPFCARVLRENR